MPHLSDASHIMLSLPVGSLVAIPRPPTATSDTKMASAAAKKASLATRKQASKVPTKKAAAIRKKKAAAIRKRKKA